MHAKGRVIRVRGFGAAVLVINPLDPGAVSCGTVGTKDKLTGINYRYTRRQTTSEVEEAINADSAVFIERV
jgi:hypothetical protein